MSEINHKDRAHALLAPSSAHRWMVCTASPIAEAQYEDEETEAAAEGTLAHEVAQVYAEAIGHGMPEVDAGLQRLRADQDRADRITPEMLQCAEGYAAYIQERMTPSSTLLLEQRLDFSEWVPDGHGTGDCIIIDNHVLTIIDYKYGQGVKVEAEDNQQMRIYALGAYREYGFVYDIDTVRMIIYQPRMNNIDETEMSVTDLIQWANNELCPKAVEAYTGKGKYVSGYHCRFCKHAGRCRELQASMCDFVTVHGLTVAVPHLTDAEYVEYFRQKKLIELWLKRMDAEIYRRLHGGDSISGLKLVAGRTSRSWTDEDTVRNTLGEEGIDFDLIYEPVKLKTPAALEKALGKKKATDLVGHLIATRPGNPIPAEVTDKRPEYEPGADFDKLD